MEKVKRFRNIWSNLVIGISLILLFSITYVSNSTNAFTQKTNDALFEGNPNNNGVSLMFNVCWGTKFIPSILEILSQKNVKATFFVGGAWASQNGDVLQAIFDGGHEIGNHGFNHKDHKKISFEQNRQEILSTHVLVKETLGIDMNLFAPPSGAFDEETLDCASELGYQTIMWSKDTIDWRDKNSDLIFSRATRRIKAGDLILMHPTKESLTALPRIVDNILSQNLKIITTGENIA